ncbi:uncharacterized protein [Leuresthes tenuis]|uniref:uncharacterized protein n=1 Tax=Leuresthes tenuis TaxID=355514 RepID=UPI003B50D1BC
MASSQKSNEESASDCESEVLSGSDSDPQSDVDLDDNEVYRRQPCKYYNNGVCKNGQNCTYLHTCRYFLAGNCRNGSRCKLSHSVSEGGPPGASSRAPDQSRERNPKLTNGRYYQWQLNDGKGWKDIKNDHIIEAQYSLPHNKSIKIYNTEYGAVSIDFNRIRVYGKELKVRRLDDGNSEWIWYCSLLHKWIKYGDKDSKGNASPVKSSDIEKQYKSNPTGSFTFSAGGETFEIKFTAMQQVGKKKKSKVTRRPLYRQQPARARDVQAASDLQRLSVGSKPKWEFEGDGGKWYEFKRRSGTPTNSSLTSDDIEKKYQQNPRNTLAFKVNGNPYMLDLGAMTQTNLKNNRTRRIRRVLL